MVASRSNQGKAKNFQTSNAKLHFTFNFPGAYARCKRAAAVAARGAREGLWLEQRIARQTRTLYVVLPDVAARG